jgi:hypothetical protein
VRSLLLGLDVSPRRLGWGLVDLVTGEPVACGCEQLWVEKPKRMREEIDWQDHPKRTSRAVSEIPLGATMHCRRAGEVQAVYVEHPISRYPGMAYDEGVAVGIAIAEVKRRWPWAPVQTLKPSEWRQLAGLPGNASKDAVNESAQLLAYHSGLRKVRYETLPQDAADGLLIAVAGQKRNAESWDRGVERGAA